MILGKGKNFTIRSSNNNVNKQHKKRDSPKQQIGIFVSRLTPKTRDRDVALHVRNETGLNMRCDELPSRHFSYKSFVLKLAPKFHNKLLNPEIWPVGTIVRKCYD